VQYNIQALRAFAAYAVVAQHIIFLFREKLAIGRVVANPHFGATGVNVFFVISGFIMALTTAKPTAPGDFLQARIVRIVPVYWLLTALALALNVSGFALFDINKGAGWQEALTSFLFLPDIQPGDTFPMPVLFIGWSLNFEMMFYAIFAGALFFGGDRRLIAAGGAIVVLWIAHLFTGNAYLHWLGGPIILAFVLGIAIWKAPGLSPTAAWTLMLAGLVMLAAPDLMEWLSRKELIWNAGAGLLVLGAVSLERQGKRISKGWLTAQGDASYSLYLLHPFVLWAIGAIAIKTGVNGTPIGLCAVAVIMFAGSVVAASVFHRFAERPVTGLLRRTPKL
jgi:exopolysaccharide production protein ExoZ